MNDDARRTIDKMLEDEDRDIVSVALAMGSSVRSLVMSGKRRNRSKRPRKPAPRHRAALVERKLEAWRRSGEIREAGDA